MLLVTHHGAAVDIGGDLPTEGLIQQVVLGSGGEILAAAHHVGDAHQMVIDHVGEVVGGQTVALEQDLIVQRAVVHSDVAEDGIVESGAALGDALADDIGHTGGQLGGHFLGAQVAAGVGSAVKFAGILLRLALLAEAVVGVAQLHQQLGILAVGVTALGLDIGGHGAAHIGTLVVAQAAFGHGAVDHIHSAVHQTALVGILDTQDEGAAVVAGNQPGVERGTQIAHMHIAGGRGGKAGTHLAVGDLGLHVDKVLTVNSHE